MHKIHLATLAILLLTSAVEAAPKDKKKTEGNPGPQATFFRQVLERNRTDDTPVVRIFLREQELVLTLGDDQALISPVSTGRRKGWTPLGEFSIIGKSANHRSSSYGKHVSRSGKVIRSNVDSRKISPPAGSRFVGAPMPNFLRMTGNGIGIHAGVLPGYPASHGCIRVPKDVSQTLFEKCPVGTKVFVLEARDVKTPEG